MRLQYLDACTVHNLECTSKGLYGVGILDTCSGGVQRVVGSAHYNLVRAVGMLTGTLTHGQQIPFCQSFYNQRGRRGHVALFYNTLYDDWVFSGSLEAVIMILLPATGIVKESTFPMAIKSLIVVRSLFPSADVERATPPSFVSIGGCNTLL